MNTLSRLRGSLRKKSDDPEGATKEEKKEGEKEGEEGADKKKKSKRLSFFDSIRKTKPVGKSNQKSQRKRSIVLPFFFSFFFSLLTYQYLDFSDRDGHLPDWLRLQKRARLITHF